MKFRAYAAVVLKKVVPVILGLVVLVGVIGVLAGVFVKKIQPGPTLVPASGESVGSNDTYEVREIVKTYVEESVGTLKASSRTEISSRVQAVITRMAVRAGDAVEADDVLVELDRAALERQLSQLKQSEAATEAALTQAADTRARYTKLHESQVITDAEFEQAVSTFNQAQAKRNQAQEAVAESEILLSYTIIKAPKPGLIVDRLAEEGDLARPGYPLLALYDPTSLRLEVPVSERLAARLKVGDELEVYIDSIERAFSATVDEKVPQALAASRSFLVKVKLPPSEDIFEGMFGRLRIPAGDRPHLCLHNGAIQRIGQLEFVDVVDPDDGSPQRRLIKTGRPGDANHVEVLSGLDKGDLVVLHKSAPRVD